MRTYADDRYLGSRDGQYSGLISSERRYVFWWGGGGGGHWHHSKHKVDAQLTGRFANYNTRLDDYEGDKQMLRKEDTVCYPSCTEHFVRVLVLMLKDII